MLICLYDVSSRITPRQVGWVARGDYEAEEMFLVNIL